MCVDRPLTSPRAGLSYITRGDPLLVKWGDSFAHVWRDEEQFALASHSLGSMGMRSRWALACVALVALSLGSGYVLAQDEAVCVCDKEACKEVRGGGGTRTHAATHAVCCGRARA
jgi:hypothetical protein